jgi:hypothetical protein
VWSITLAPLSTPNEASHLNPRLPRWTLLSYLFRLLDLLPISLSPLPNGTPDPPRSPLRVHLKNIYIYIKKERVHPKNNAKREPLRLIKTTRLVLPSQRYILQRIHLFSFLLTTVNILITVERNHSGIFLNSTLTGVNVIKSSRISDKFYNFKFR